MHVIICVDNQNGIAFNKRRQSRDGKLCEKVLEMSAGRTLRIAPYSEPLFNGLGKFVVSETPLNEAETGEFCFVEKQQLAENEDQIEHLIICRWNRDYPADMYLDIDLTKWTLITTEEIVGKSHEKITLEVWRKK